MGAFVQFRRREWEATPEGQAELEKQQKQQKEWEKKYQKEKQQAETERLKKAAEEAEKSREAAEEKVEIDKLKTARDEAFEDVGITLDRRDRENMRTVVFLIKKQIHEVLRQAAFDQRMTMQAILRSGLAMWFVAHGYNVSIDEMDLRPRGEKKGQSRHA